MWVAKIHYLWKSFNLLGIFEWGMLYKEGSLPDKESANRVHHSEPYRSPTHAGGLFAIKRSWFKELGWYDPGRFIICCFTFRRNLVFQGPVMHI